MEHVMMQITNLCKGGNLSSYFLGVLFLTLYILGVSTIQAAEPEIRIHYLGHASFILQFDNGVSVLTDYGQSRAYGLASPIYDFGDFQPEVVTYSHAHPDHQRAGVTFDHAQVLTENDSLSLKGLEIVPIRTRENSLSTDDNTSFLFLYKGLKILHLADAQGYIKNIQQEEIRQRVKELYPAAYNLVFMPIGWRAPILKEAEAFVDVLQAKRIIPMHYWSPRDKQTFFKDLNTQKETAGKSYHIQELAGATYAFSAADEVTPFTIISLEPGPFEQAERF